MLTCFSTLRFLRSFSLHRGLLATTASRIFRGMRSLLRQPLLHFLVLGGLLYAAQVLWQPAPHETIAVDEAWVQQLRAEWRRETGRWPTLDELQASLQRQLDDERLLREALRLELDARDSVARSRLIANLRFALDESGRDDAQLFEQARRLDLAARDLVVRRRLVQLMEHRLLEPQLPGDADLQAYVRERPQRYARPARYTFEQRYFSADAHGAAGATAAARAALETLQREPAAAVGEPFLLGARFSGLSDTQVAERFGPAFARALGESSADRWIGPLVSPYGAHLVRVSAMHAAQAADYAAVRTQAAYAWLAEHEPQRLQAALAPLRARYPAQLAPALIAQGLRA